MDLAALKAELTTDPAGLGYAPLITSGDDAGLVARLNAKAYRGYVPIVELAAYCAKAGITGAVLVALETPVGTDGMTSQFKGVLHTVLTLVQIDFRLTSADVDDPAFGASLDALAAATLVTADQKAAILALGDGRRSRAESLWGDGTAVAADDVTGYGRGLVAAALAAAATGYLAANSGATPAQLRWAALAAADSDGLSRAYLPDVRKVVNVITAADADVTAAVNQLIPAFVGGG